MQYSLSFLVAMLTIITVATAFRIELRGIVSCYFRPVVVVVFIVPFILASRERFRLPWGFSLPLIACTSYACFTHYRITTGFDDIAWSRPFPYPDKLIDHMACWLGPPPESIPAGSIDFDGGSAEILYTVIVTALVLSAMTGWAIGKADPKRAAR